MFEIGGLVLVTPPFAWFSGEPVHDSVMLLAVVALIAAVWNTLYNTCFDWIEGRVTGRTADRRRFPLRLAQAVGFEGGLMAMTLPIVVAWTDLSWGDAVLANLGIATGYVVYAFLFNLAYDRLFPIDR